MRVVNLHDEDSIVETNDLWSGFLDDLDPNAFCRSYMWSIKEISSGIDRN